MEAARRRFLHDGFTAPTIAVIAGEASVSVDTIYKTFGGKPGLVRSICEQALEGEGPVPAERRSDGILEQIVGRLSLEPSVTAARWRVESVTE